jgi:hypothetical protein
VLGGRERFDQLTGQNSSVGHVIAIWGQGPVSQILSVTSHFRQKLVAEVGHSG